MNSVFRQHKSSIVRLSERASWLLRRQRPVAPSSRGARRATRRSRAAHADLSARGELALAAAPSMSGASGSPRRFAPRDDGDPRREGRLGARKPAQTVGCIETPSYRAPFRIWAGVRRRRLTTLVMWAWWANPVFGDCREAKVCRGQKVAGALGPPAQDVLIDRQAGRLAERHREGLRRHAGDARQLVDGEGLVERAVDATHHLAERPFREDAPARARTLLSRAGEPRPITASAQAQFGPLGEPRPPSAGRFP